MVSSMVDPTGFEPASSGDNPDMVTSYQHGPGSRSSRKKQNSLTFVWEVYLSPDELVKTNHVWIDSNLSII
jgi:hypothetical protein